MTRLFSYDADEPDRSFLNDIAVVDIPTTTELACPRNAIAMLQAYPIWPEAYGIVARMDIFSLH
jgi:hypothetical protein